MTRTNREARPNRSDRDQRPNRPERGSRQSRDGPITDRTASTMGEVSHTNPYGDPSVANRPFQRGPVVVADGGRRGARDEDGEARESAETDEGSRADEETEPTRMKDVDHTPPYGDGGDVDRVFERGGTEEPVESEE